MTRTAFALWNQKRAGSLRGPRRLLAAALVAAGLAGAPAQAQDRPADADNMAAIYLWATAVDADMTVRNQTVPVDASFDDLFGDLKVGGSAHYEWRARPWGFNVDTTYVDLDSDFTGPALGLASGKSAVTLWEAEAAAVRRWQTGEQGIAVDLLLGARYWLLDMEIDPDMAAAFDGDETWLDAMLGGRLLVPFARSWLFSFRMDVAAGGSDFTWNSVALLSWRFSHVVGLDFGYRYLDLDYENDDDSDRFGLDGSLSGPVVGFSFNW